jgi:hypothetical protein
MTFITPKSRYIPGNAILSKIKKITKGIDASKGILSEDEIGNEMGHEMKSRTAKMSTII